MDEEVNVFIEGIGAFEPKPLDEPYATFRGLFKRSNYFILKERFIIVKVSRSPRPFWGVGRKYLDFFNKYELDYLRVLLISGHEGWVFDKRDIKSHTENGHWKLNPKDEIYKINPPLPGRNSFLSHKQFLKTIGIAS